MNTANDLSVTITIRVGRYVIDKVDLGPIEYPASHPLQRQVQAWAHVNTEAFKRHRALMTEMSKATAEQKAMAVRVEVVREWLTKQGITDRQIEKIVSRLQRHSFENEVWAPFVSIIKIKEKP